jgi:PEGA domain
VFWLRLLRAAILLWVSTQVASVAFAQGAASSSGSASASGGNYTVMGSTSSSKPSPQPQNKSAHLVDKGGPPADEANRKALEERAGSNGGKLLLRSTPSGAQVFIDGAFVGRTPLLLIVSPGRYKIQMHGPRESFSERTAEVVAQETQEIALKLSERYPEHVATR